MTLCDAMSAHLTLAAWQAYGCYALAAALGLAAGAASMAIYGRYSPQERLRELDTEIADLQRRLAAYDGEFAGAMALTRQNLALALRRLGLALVPAVASSVPVLALLPLVGESYLAYFAAVATAALAVKFLWKVV